MPSDRTAMQFALRTATDCDWTKGPRIVWLKNTLSLSEFYISEALTPDAEALDNVTVVSEPMDVIFDEEGNVKELRWSPREPRHWASAPAGISGCRPARGGKHPPKCGGIPIVMKRVNQNYKN